MLSHARHALPHILFCCPSPIPWPVLGAPGLHPPIHPPPPPSHCTPFAPAMAHAHLGPCPTLTSPLLFLPIVPPLPFPSPMPDPNLTFSPPHGVSP